MILDSTGGCAPVQQQGTLVLETSSLSSTLSSAAELAGGVISISAGGRSMHAGAGGLRQVRSGLPRQLGTDLS